MSLDPDDALIGNWFSANAGDANEPPGEDQRSQGDDQIRRLKGTVRRHFPGFTGTSAAPKMVNASEDQLNGLSDYVPGNGTVESRLATLEAGNAKIPSGTTLLFYQASLPAGYTDAGIEDCILRVVADGTTGGGGVQGTDNPVLMDKVISHLHSNPAYSGGEHNHPLYEKVVGGGSSRVFIDLETIFDYNGQTERDTGGSYLLLVPNRGGHNHSGNSGPADGGVASWTPKYVDIIAGTKT